MTITRQILEGLGGPDVTPTLISYGAIGVYESLCDGSPVMRDTYIAHLKQEQAGLAAGIDRLVRGMAQDQRALHPACAADKTPHAAMCVPCLRATARIRVTTAFCENQMGHIAHAAGLLLYTYYLLDTLREKAGLPGAMGAADAQG